MKFSAVNVVTLEIDTVVVPAKEENFRAVFLAENRWYRIRIAPDKKHHLKYIAVYRLAPTSAITHIASIRSIESDPARGGDWCVINFSGEAQPIRPIPLLNGGRVKPFQMQRYTTRKKLEAASNLDDIWEG
jgi:hypothetical protein